MLRNVLQGDVCEKVQGLPGPCSDTLLKQRRASAFYKNNPDEILGKNFNTFTGTPLGGPLDYNVPGYEDAPGTDFREKDIDLCKMKKELEGQEEDHVTFNENEISGIASNLVGMVPTKSMSEDYNVSSKEEFLDNVNISDWIKKLMWIIFAVGIVIIIVLLVVYM